MPYFNRYDICEAYFLLECYYNVSGILLERKKNHSVSVQLARIRFKPALNLDYETLSENGQEIYNQFVDRHFARIAESATYVVSRSVKEGDDTSD